MVKGAVHKGAYAWMSAERACVHVTPMRARTQAVRRRGLALNIFVCVNWYSVHTTCLRQCPLLASISVLFLSVSALSSSLCHLGHGVITAPAPKPKFEG